MNQGSQPMVAGMSQMYNQPPPQVQSAGIQAMGGTGQQNQYPIQNQAFVNPAQLPGYPSGLPPSFPSLFPNPPNNQTEVRPNQGQGGWNGRTMGGGYRGNRGGMGRGGGQGSRRPPPTDGCSKCGFYDCTPETCPARGQTCFRCEGMGHYARMCRGGANQ